MTRVVAVYGTRAGPGGLGIHAATVIAGLATAAPVVALGPGPALDWPLETPIPTAVNWIRSPPVRRSWLANRVLRRIRPGRLVFQHDRTVGRWAASELDRIRPGCVYTFTQVGLESMRWAKARGLPPVLDNPNGHIRGFSEVCRHEWTKWLGRVYHGHPTPAMVDRIEEE